MMTKNNELNFIKKIIYCEKNYDKAIAYIENSTFSLTYDYQLLSGIAYFYKYDLINSYKFFNNINDKYKAGYCKLLSGNIYEAYELWKKTPPSPACNWGMFFCELFMNQVKTKPTFLQIRTFLERDLNLFLKFNLVEYVQKIIDVSEFLFEINSETNKFIAKAFLYNNYPEYAKEYFERAFDYTHKDAELYYLSGLYYLMLNNKIKAKNHFENALYINPNYIPAQNYLEKLQ